MHGPDLQLLYRLWFQRAGAARLRDAPFDKHGPALLGESGGAKLVHGSGGIVPLRAA
jgi:hypothetical protein